MVKIMLICYFKLTTGFSNLLAVKKFLISYPFHWVLIAFEQMLHPSHPFCDERDLLLSACLVLKLLWFTQLIWVVWFSLFQVYFIFFGSPFRHSEEGVCLPGWVVCGTIFLRDIACWRDFVWSTTPYQNQSHHYQQRIGWLSPKSGLLDPDVRRRCRH